ncbi:MAG TPA: carboxypeptidase regulatory-like domain-containing protein [Pyrinomonadaceae bacterium]|jgi:hypothetical protein|nr:carboxypeptidase regulatory-like domain-containing protein [Pyrinomonadaceae bacterium]
MRSIVLTIAATVLVSVAIMSAVKVWASSPSSGTLTDVSGPVTYAAGPFNVANASPVPQVDVGPRCDALTFPCDNFALTVTLPSGYAAAHPNASVKFTLSWGDTGSGASDYDLYIYNGTVGNLNGSQPADAQSSSGSNPEVANFSPLTDGTRTFSVKIVPYTPTNETVNVKIELLPGTPGAPCTVNCGPFGGPDPTVPGVPRYQNFYAPNGSSAQSGSGEFNIGFNPHTQRIMTMNRGPVWRLTPGEVQTPALPECCEAFWEDKSAVSTNTGLDPILWTDQVSGRTFASNSTAGANALYAYSDNDGDAWVPIGVGPPNLGVDHQTIGTGACPTAVLGCSIPAVNQGQFALYCAQSLALPTGCQRSLDLGMTWGPGVPATTTDCAGLHGHVRIAPNGTAWLPVKNCAVTAGLPLQGGSRSTDAGVTWTEFKIPNTTPQASGSDPSVALDSSSRAYYCYVNSQAGGLEGHARVAVSEDGGATWIRDIDLGATHGIVNAVFPEAIGGTDGRAACGFLGTNVAGDYQNLNFPGKWYLYIATTYDQGVNWTTVNATPNDPVQSMSGIWQGGGGNQNRNLLDFNEITMDDKGRVLFGYSDGCVTGPCIAGTAGNDFTAHMRVARQFGGKTLNAAFDVAEPVLPKPSCLSGTRDGITGSHLSWKVPDNGGSDITGYQIRRGTTAGGETVLVANTGNTRDTYNDTTALASVPHYFYVIKAITAFGVGNQSNEIDLPLGAPPPIESACALSGLTILTDPVGDSLDMQAGHDVRRLQIAEPVAYGPNKLVFTLKMENLAVVPPSTQWPITFDAGGVNYTVRMTNSPADGATTTPIFQVGPTAGTLVAADPASNFNADGTIRIVVPRSAIGDPAVATQLTNFLVRIADDLAVVTITPDNMSDSLSPTGSYTIVGNLSCLAPTAASVSVSGRVLTADGSGMSAATVRLTASDGKAMMARTNSFGYFRLEGVKAGESYIASATHKRYRFAPRFVNVADEIADLDFTPEPEENGAGPAEPITSRDPVPQLSPKVEAPMRAIVATSPVSGRVLTADGRPVPNVLVRLVDDAGAARITRSDRDGYFGFKNVPMGASYLVSASHKRFRFHSSRINASDAVTGLEVTAEP